MNLTRAIMNDGTPTSAETLVDMGFTVQEISNANAALITILTAVGTFTLDGSTPAADSGHTLAVNVPLLIEGIIVRALQFFSAGGVVTVTLFTDSK